MPERPVQTTQRSLADLATCVVHLRTSGYDVASGAVTGIAAIRLAPGRQEMCDAFQWELPDMVATEQPEGSGGAQAAAFAPVWPELSAFLSDTLVVAHGGVWTQTFLRKATLAIGVDWMAPRFLCTRRLARAFFPNHASYKLEALTEELGLTPVRPAACTDRCLAVAELYRRCLRRMAGSGLSDLADLDAFLARAAGLIDGAAVRR